MTESEKETFIGGVEFARDWNFEIPPEDVLMYEKLIAEREEKRHEQSNIDGEAHERPEYQIHAAE